MSSSCAPVRRAALAALAALGIALLLAGCPARGPESESPLADGSAPAAETPSTEAAPVPRADPAQGAVLEGSADGPVDDVPRPASLPSLMRRAGFDDASPADLDTFVHLPPGAEGQAGTFGRGEQTVRVALIGYPNDRYVRPHVTDVRERVRVLPEPREAIVANGRWVVHVVAANREAAETLAEQLRQLLGW